MRRRWVVAILMGMLGAALITAGVRADSSAPVSTPSTAAIDASLRTSVQLLVEPRENAVELNWTSDLPHIAQYFIERSQDDGKTWKTLATVDANAREYEDASVLEGITYLYRVIALNSSGQHLGNSPDMSIVAPTHKNIMQAIKGETITLKDMLDPKFWQSSVNTFVLAALAFIPRLVVAVVLFIIFWGIYRMIRRIVLGSMAKAHVDPSIRDMLGALIKWSIMGFGLVIACNQVGIEIAALLTGVSIIGLAIGFAAQETMANFIAGVVIFWDKPFKVGDWIVIEDMFGQIQRVSFRSTRMLNLLGQTIVMPNTTMLSSRVANHSTHPHVRVDIPIGIAYKESIDHARKALLATIKGDERICKEPSPQVAVEQCAESSVNITLRLWIADESAEKAIYHEYLEKAKNALDAANIEIPFPHMQLLVKESATLRVLADEPLQPTR